MAATTTLPQPISWLAAQKRPFIAANVAALLLFAIGALSEIPRHMAIGSFSWLLWPGPLFYLVIVLAFLAPLWLVQAIVYAQMWQMGQPIFVDPALWPDLEPHRRCRFLLSLRTMVIVLAVLHLRTTHKRRVWTRPLWLFLALFASSLFTFCVWTSSLPMLPPIALVGSVIFWCSALIFGLSHLVQSE